MIDLGDIPTRGLIEVLSSWALAGSVTTVEALTEAIGLISPLDSETAWTPEDALKRADRLAWEHLRSAVTALPPAVEEWLEALPAIGVSRSSWSDTPQPPVDWARSVRRMGGWPPPAHGQVAYLHRRRSRLYDESAGATLAWGRQQLSAVLEAAEELGAMVPPDCRDRIEAIPALVAPSQPDTDDLEALRLLGPPFTELSSALAIIIELYSDPYVFARELLLPDDELRWRLFHLGCYGELLAEASSRIGPITSTRPLMGGTRRATHVLRDGVDPGVTYEVWFEASGVWTLSPGRTSHADVARAVRGTSGGLVPDVAMVRLRDGTPERMALLEVKYSHSGQYVFGHGYAEALGYGLEAVTHFGVDTLSLAVGPADMIRPEGATADRIVGEVQLRTGAAPPARAAAHVVDWLTS